MPELPEVETVKRGLEPHMRGQAITRLQLNRANLRFPFPENFAAKCENAVIETLERRSKYLLFHLSNQHTIIAHLGMSGSFRVEEELQGAFHHERNRQAAHDHVVFHLPKAKVIYNDPRRFGLMDVVATSELHNHALIKVIGLEPFSNQLNAQYIYEKSRGKKSPLKLFLLDQSIVAGLGNIYVCEVLFLSKLSPFAASQNLTLNDCETVVRHIRAVLTRAIEAGGSSLNDHSQVNGELGYFQHNFNVYDRENTPCPACQSPIIRAKQGGRSSFYCESCQGEKS